MAVTILASLLNICRAGPCTITSFSPDNADPSSTDDYSNAPEVLTGSGSLDMINVICQSKGEPNSLAFVKANLYRDNTSLNVANICKINLYSTNDQEYQLRGTFVYTAEGVFTN